MPPSFPQLQGQVAVITGANAGIGRAIALALAEQGVRCALAARRRAPLEELADEIARAGGEALVIPTDVSEDSALQALIRKTVERWDGLQILVNNAGVYHQASVEKLDRLQAEAVIQVNLLAPIFLAKYALPHLKKRPGSAVINISSMAGLMGFRKGAIYCASKYGILGFSESLFEEVRSFGVKVCAICPGYVATSMVEGYGLPTDKMIPPEDVATTVLDVLTLSEKSCPTQIILRPQYPVTPESP